jgi:hypothetical protein
MLSHARTKCCEVIIEVGAEGGSITLYGFRTDQGWVFSRKVIDQTPELIDEDRIKTNSDCVHSREAALELLDRYPWPVLYPISVHPGFGVRTLWAVQERLDKHENSGVQLDRWRAVCRG